MSKKINMFAVSEPYKPVGQYLLMADESFGEEEYTIYRDVSSKAYVIGTKGKIPIIFQSIESVIIPEFRIGSQPMVNRKDIRKYGKDIKNRAKLRSNDAMDRQKDIEIFKVINASLSKDHSITIEFLDAKCIFYGFSILEHHELTANSILMHPMMFAEIKSWEHPQFKEYPIGFCEYRGEFNNVRIYISTMCPKNAVFILAAPEYVGVCIEFEKRSIIDCIDESNDKEGYILSESIGIGIINSYSIARILVQKEKSEHIVKEDDINVKKTKSWKFWQKR